MFIADLKGKLSLSEYVSEDFLTSSVFSVFNYIDSRWLEKFLKLAVNTDNEHLNININCPKYTFWPWFSNIKEYGGGSEPDVVIYSEDKVIIIEVKNYANKSGEGVVTSNTDKSTDVIVDQLGREYFVGTEKLLNTISVFNDKQSKINQIYLVYLTRHNFFPSNDIDKTIEAIGQIDSSKKTDARKNIYWLSWYKVISILEEILLFYKENSFESKITKELLEFLDRREINCFDGFKFLNDIKELNKGIHKEEHIFYSKSFYHYWSDIYLDVACLNKVKDIFYKQKQFEYWESMELNNTIDVGSDKLFYRGKETDER